MKGFAVRNKQVRCGKQDSNASEEDRAHSTACSEEDEEDYAVQWRRGKMKRYGGTLIAITWQGHFLIVRSQFLEPGKNWSRPN